MERLLAVDLAMLVPNGGPAYLTTFAHGLITWS